MLNRIGLATKVSIFVGVFMLIGLSIGLFLQLKNVRDNSYEQAVTLAQEASKSYAKNVTGDLEIVATTLNNTRTLVNYSASNKVLNRENIIDLLKGELEKTPSILAIYTLWEPNAFDGKDSQYINKPGYDASGRFIPYVARANGQVIVEPLLDYEQEGAGDYYLIPKKTKKSALIEPYYYKVDGKEILIISVVMPIINNTGEFVGIVGADISLAALQEKIQMEKPMGGFVSVLTNKGMIVAHGANSDFVGKNYLEVDQTRGNTIANITKGDSFIENRRTAGTDSNSLEVYEPVRIPGIETCWSYASVIPEANIYSEYNKLSKKILPTTIFGIIVLIIATFWIVKVSLKPVRKASEHLQLLADSDFTSNLPATYLQLGGEIGVLAKSMQQMQVNIRGLISEVFSQSLQTDKSMSHTEKNVEVLNAQLKDISATTQQLAAGMQETAASAEEMSNTSTELERSVKTLSQKTQQGIAATKEMMSRANKLQCSAVSSRDNGNNMYKSANTKLKSAIQQAAAVKQINALLDTIVNITSQTNLLAFNAAIEAARAGEAGRGFAVVADEIRKLAEESKKAANEIQNITDLTVSSVNNLAESAAQLLAFVDKEVMKDYEVLVLTGDQYSQDAKYIDDILTDFQGASDRLCKLIDDLLKAIEVVGKSADEGANNTSTIAEKSAVIFQQFEEVVRQAENAKNCSANLNSLLTKFKV